jgi:hypothetical protein
MIVNHRMVEFSNLIAFNSPYFRGYIMQVAGHAKALLKAFQSCDQLFS